ncbi:DUF427 domain-containing protein [Methanoculleus sp. FWC-SCC1]|uniref:DUF427 domain-containing protein n=1 Tax=Methanoculleus frigidifontis TaxID=2584085 RepID=A0ABT8M7G3_9EURY|nr:DUF427 domain-containing protein [Methanoculleus sp. FWC-SCC1]MDN7023867.1 DUF427 domain-containing protein [Methanoculleus sp. FWC-SCC1]
MPRVTAAWNGKVIAASNNTIVIEGNHYFPSDDVNHEYLRESRTQTICDWKGVAQYYDIIVNGEVNDDAAWYYPEPKPAAQNIQNRIAFWRGVKVLRETG